MCRNMQWIGQSLALCLLVVVPSIGQAAEDEPALRSYEIRVDLFSIEPGAGIATYQDHGSGAVSGAGTMRMGVLHDARHFDVNVTPLFRKGQLLAKVTVEPAASDSMTKMIEKEFDLKELQSQTLDLARDSDGRVYRMNLTPHVVTHPKPTQFRAGDLRLDFLSFPSCPVILNDQEYVGHLAASAASLAYIDILNVGLVEFSLLHLKDSQPWGSLQDGILQIRHENGTTISINGVKNGWHRETLPGGPYTIWVRWKDSTMTEEAYRAGIQNSIKEIKSGIANGDPTIGPDTLKDLERLTGTEHPRMMTSGLRPVRSDELEP